MFLVSKLLSNFGFGLSFKVWSV